MTAPSRRSDKTITLHHQVVCLAKREASNAGQSTAAYVADLILKDAIPSGDIAELTADDLRRAVWKLMPDEWAMEPHPGVLFEDADGNHHEPADMGINGPFVRLDVGGPMSAFMCASADAIKAFADDLREVADNGGRATIKLRNAFSEIEGCPDLYAQRQGNGVVFKYLGRDETLSSVSSHYIPVAALALECVALLAQKQEELDNEPH
ncbi:hypothetical protein [uncultured Mameliella sp.]|uniref:hypothetical protein n=1 Tax=uncultured Mameliella sp. TaxID=1447087 RepID=UPI002608F355|nr:hypothetical protein [uncultured Mameliella sp.]